MTENDLRALILRAQTTIEKSRIIAQQAREIAKQARDQPRASRGYQPQQGDAAQGRLDCPTNACHTTDVRA